MNTENKLSKYACKPCRWEYDEEKGMPERGIAKGTRFEELPDDFTCPKCGATKWMFEKVAE